MKKSFGVLLFAATLIISCKSQNVNDQISGKEQSPSSKNRVDGTSLIAENGTRGIFSDKPTFGTWDVSIGPKSRRPDRLQPGR